MRYACLRYGICLALAAMIPATTSWAAPAEQPEYIQEDAKIYGKEIHAFPDDGRNVTVVLGDFYLTVGDRVLGGRDAVLWVRTYRFGRATRHEMTVYIWGDARVSEPAKGTTTDREMLVTLRFQGQLGTAGEISRKPLTDFPLYRRAKAALQESIHPTPGKKADKPVHHPPPDLVVRDPGATTRPKPKPGRKRKPKPKEAPPKTPLAGKKPQAVKPPQPVTLEAGKFSSRMKGQTRITIAKDGVYLSQGNPHSDLFLELRSQAGVIFSVPQGKKKLPKKDTRSPLSPQLGSGALGGGRETVTGVYLEGDVIISRGERTLSGSVAYYDFITDRAIILDVVFRTIQEQRNIPIWLRATEARLLSARESWFKDAKVSTSDFHTPTYHVGAKSTYVFDQTKYDEDGVRLSEYTWLTKMKHATLNIRGVPVAYSPYTRETFTDGHTALRKLQVGRDSDYGAGVQTEWHLFRLLGLVQPSGFKGVFSFDLYQRQVAAGVDLKYARQTYTGYSKIEGLLDQEQSDDFGQAVRNVDAPPQRGRVLARHKQFLPEDWQLQFELSYLCDRNYLRQFHPDEFRAGKEQETLLYAKKQRDNWAFDALLKYRINRFQEYSESLPDVGLYLIGEPLWGDRLTFYSESHAGVQRYRYPNDTKRDDSGFFDRLDTRQEIAVPLRAGPVNLMPYAVGRLTHWGKTPADSGELRPYGQVGAKANIHIWRVYNDIESRLWDVHRLKHVMTPEVAALVSGSGNVRPVDLYPMDSDIEGIDGLGGAVLALRNVLQTKRGPAGDRKNVDWMRLDLSLGFYGNTDAPVPSDGRFFWYRPEHSLGRNHLNMDYQWQISDTTLFEAYWNYDLDRGIFGRAGASLAVRRSPRLSYLLGLRAVHDMNSTVGTVGVNYQLNRKYTLSLFEQYDFDYRDGRNVSTTFTITRRLPRWYVAVSLQYDEIDDEMTAYLTIWPEGVPDLKIGTGRMSVLGRSSEN